MAEVIGLAASIIQIAGAGASLSKALYSYVGSVACADQQISDIAGDVEITSNALNNVGEVFQNEASLSIVSKTAIQDASNLIKRCESVFAAIQGVIDKRQKVTKDGKKTLSVFGKIAWPLKEQKIQVLQSRLESLKNSLILLFHVIQLANGQARGQLEKDALDKERDNIRQLYQRQQDSIQALASLESKLNMVSLDDQATLHDGEVGSLSQTSLISMMLNPSHMEPAKRLRKAQDTVPEQAKDVVFSTDESEMSESESVADADMVTHEDLAACADQVHKLLRKLSVLQKSLSTTQPPRVRRNRVHKLYRRFCHRFESNLGTQIALVEGISKPTSQIPLPAPNLDFEAGIAMGLQSSGFPDKPENCLPKKKHRDHSRQTRGYKKKGRSRHLPPLSQDPHSAMPQLMRHMPEYPCRTCGAIFNNIEDFQSHSRSKTAHTQPLSSDRVEDYKSPDLFGEESTTMGLDPNDLSHFDFDAFLHEEVEDQGPHFFPEHSRTVSASLPNMAVPSSIPSLASYGHTPPPIAPINKPLPPRIDDNSESEYTRTLVLPELARCQEEARKLGRTPPTEEQVRADLLRDYQMGLMTLVCGDQSKRKKMYRVADPNSAEISDPPNIATNPDPTPIPSLNPISDEHIPSRSGYNSFDMRPVSRSHKKHKETNDQSSSLDGRGEISGRFSDLGKSPLLPAAESQRSGLVTMPDSPLFVNQKQFNRIRIRRQQRQAQLQLQGQRRPKKGNEEPDIEEDDTIEDEAPQDIDTDENAPEEPTSYTANPTPPSPRNITKSSCRICRRRSIVCDGLKPSCTNCLKAKRPCEPWQPGLDQPIGHLGKTVAVGSSQTVPPPLSHPQYIRSDKPVEQEQEPEYDWDLMAILSSKKKKGKKKKCKKSIRIDTERTTPLTENNMEELLFQPAMEDAIQPVESTIKPPGPATSVRDMQNRANESRNADLFPDYLNTVNQPFFETMRAQQLQSIRKQSNPVNFADMNKEQSGGVLTDVALSTPNFPNINTIPFDGHLTNTGLPSPIVRMEMPPENKILTENDKTVAAACFQCRRSKRRCDRGVPCGSCNDLSIDCMYETRKIKRPIRSYSGSLEERLKQVENIVKDPSMVEQGEASTSKDGSNIEWSSLPTKPSPASSHTLEAQSDRRSSPGEDRENPTLINPQLLIGEAHSLRFETGKGPTSPPNMHTGLDSRQSTNAPINQSPANNGGDSSPAGGLISVQDKATSPSHMEISPTSPTHGAASSAYGATTPDYEPTSPLDRGASPGGFGNSATSPAFAGGSPISPQYGPTSPSYGPTSSTYRPTSTAYFHISDEYIPLSGAPRAASLAYHPTSPAYQPTSPCFSPTSPDDESITSSGPKRTLTFVDDDEGEDFENCGPKKSKKSRKVRDEDESGEVATEDLELIESAGENRKRRKTSITAGEGISSVRVETEDKDIVDVLLGQWTNLGSATRSYV